MSSPNRNGGGAGGGGGVEGAELVGSLRRKKEPHGFFEDPWKAKVLCWVKGGMLQLKLAEGGGGKTGFQGQEGFDLAKWKVEKGDKGRFSLVAEKAEPLRLKADTAAEAELWVAKLKTAHVAAIKKSKEAEMVQLKTAHVAAVKKATDAEMVQARKTAEALLQPDVTRDTTPGDDTIDSPRSPESGDLRYKSGVGGWEGEAKSPPLGRWGRQERGD
ncbi:hypothetical protein T484DRAFT_1909725 [Baffinella frigidus]|nr:hypothetical protein T484DRAFT_1909725 [Cryptophyta sp. CCMP2293]